MWAEQRLSPGRDTVQCSAGGQQAGSTLTVVFCWETVVRRAAELQGRVSRPREPGSQHRSLDRATRPPGSQPTNRTIYH